MKIIDFRIRKVTLSSRRGGLKMEVGGGGEGGGVGGAEGVVVDTGLSLDTWTGCEVG
jgi:hypothetical protein